MSWRLGLEAGPAMRDFLTDSDLQPDRVRDTIHHAPLGVTARLMAPVDRRLSHVGAFGAALLVVEVVKPK